MGSGLLSARNASGSAQNKHLAMPDRDTVKTQSRDMSHIETWKLETAAKTRHTSVETLVETEPLQDQDMTRTHQGIR